MSRRSDRLFRIVNFLQGRRRAVTAARIAVEFGVTPRTIYRDIQDLMLSGVPISGEAGVGYVLDRSFTLPPVQFDAEELECLVLGLSMACSWTDETTAATARQTMGKIKALLGTRQREALQGVALFAPHSAQKIPWRVDFSAIRRAIRVRQTVQIEYVDESGAHSVRTVRPLALAFFGSVWLMLGWCELRAGFRNFRLDRLRALTVLSEHFRDEPGKRLHDYLKSIPFQDNLRD
ncbi:YafY family protein [Magnetovibrio sp.]|uniref:helix-turn-helix transcriptional regulator n=1 Tax=Magnetovibrio sp. TaxID=2024836 RepID=UPI002F9443F2